MNKVNIFKVVSLLVLFLILLSQFNPVSVESQEASGSGFAISPPSFELNANQGDTIKNTIKVNNTSTKALSFNVKAENFVAYGEGGQVSLTEEESTYSISRWIEFKKNSFLLQPGKTEIFDFTIKIPKDAEPGSHYGAVVFSTGGSTEGLEGGGAAVLQEIGSLILIRLPGDVTESANIESFAPAQDLFRDPKVTLNALLENTGSVHFKPSGFINIYDFLGNKVQVVEVKGRNILPGSKRLFDEQFDFDKIGNYYDL
jgi:hypothetical protein